MMGAAAFFVLVAILQSAQSKAIQEPQAKKAGEQDVKPIDNSTIGSVPSVNANLLHKLEWTKEKEPLISNGKNDQKSAFRDVVVEKTGQRLFDNFMEKVHHPDQIGYQILRDPMYLRDGMKVKKTTNLIDVSMEAERMVIHGLHALKLTYIRVIRHFGLQDIKVNIRVSTDAKIEGKYKINGQALGFLPVTGDGSFNIDIKGFSLSAITFLVLKNDEKKEDHLVIRELEVTVDYKDVHFEFQNLMGGGMVGSAANLVINAMGEAIIDSQRQSIVNLMKTRFKEEVSRFL